MKMDPEIILNFWFKEVGPKKWFTKDSELDKDIRLRFGLWHDKASQCELYYWRDKAKGRLAEIIILDQFSRNIYRDEPRAFAQDPLALVLAQETVLRKMDQDLSVQERPFIYMPYLHSESMEIHKLAIKLFEAPGLAQSLDYENLHRQIIEKFGRYPHRNAALGRRSNAEELEFLKENPDF
jgi:uncharacterized protein (DUF924 family)